MFFLSSKTLFRVIKQTKLRKLFSTYKNGGRFLITGGNGQIGTELSKSLNNKYGRDNVLCTDITPSNQNILFEKLNVLEADKYREICINFKPDCIIHLAAVLSARGEQDVNFALKLNNDSFKTALDLAVEFNTQLFVPSTIAVFGPTSPKVQTPNETVLVPHTIYGVTKVYMELLGNYYHQKFGIDFRSIRYPGAISPGLPGGGTTDYAVDIFHSAIKNRYYECFLGPHTRMPMIYIDDLIDGTMQFLEADSSKLKTRVYNFTAFSFTPEELYNEIKKHLPDFSISYKPDFRQKIADSWPQSIDDSRAKKDWNWQPNINFEAMTKIMLQKTAEMYGINDIKLAQANSN